ncbi:MAG TPA: DUF2378 family protein [Polyangiales bacterium]
MPSQLKDFFEPDWNAPLDAVRAVQSVPDASTISGMFLSPIANEARRLNKALPSARERYVPFRFYPLREHASLLIEACQVLFPGKPLRMTLRKLGRGAPNALLTSTLGRAGIGAAQGVHDITQAMAKAYAINVPGCQLTLVDATAKRCIVQARGLPYFVDCHHVGAFEGVLRYAGVDGDVRVRLLGADSADYLLTWR